MAPDVADFVETHGGRAVGETTMTKYGRWIERFEAWRPGGDVNADMLRQWDAYLQDEERADYPWENGRGRPAPAQYAYRTRIVALSAAKMWAQYEFEADITTDVQDIADGEPAEFEPTVIKPDEIERTITMATTDCDNDGCQAAIRVGYDAIMRGAEVAEIQREDVDLDAGTLYVHAKKGSESGKIELSPKAIERLASYMKQYPDRDYLFRNAYGNRWTPAAWNKHFRTQHHDAGFHAFARHSAVTNRLRSGEDFGSIYVRARHTEPATTLKYIGLVPDATAPGWAGTI